MQSYSPQQIDEFNSILIILANGRHPAVDLVRAKFPVRSSGTNLMLAARTIRAPCPSPIRA